MAANTDAIQEITRLMRGYEMPHRYTDVLIDAEMLAKDDAPDSFVYVVRRSMISHPESASGTHLISPYPEGDEDVTEYLLQADRGFTTDAKDYYIYDPEHSVSLLRVSFEEAYGWLRAKNLPMKLEEDVSEILHGLRDVKDRMRALFNDSKAHLYAVIQTRDAVGYGALKGSGYGPTDSGAMWKVRSMGEGDAFVSFTVDLVTENKSEENEG